MPLSVNKSVKCQSCDGCCEVLSEGVVWMSEKEMEAGGTEKEKYKQQNFRERDAN